MPSPTKSPSVIESVVLDTVDFPTAIRAVIEGKKITKLEWNDKKYYGTLFNNQLMLHKPNAEYEFYPWIISDSDLLGTDWVVIP